MSTSNDEERYDWRYENAINNKKAKPDVVTTGVYKYSAGRTNKSLANYHDTVLYANDMNLNRHLSPQMQFDYLFYSIRKKFRKTERKHVVEDDAFACVQEYYKYSDKKTKEALSVLSPEQIEVIRRKLHKGGIV